jgi:hypothetical protein
VGGEALSERGLAGWVVACARRTLGSQSARVWHTSFLFPASGPVAAEDASTGEGVADLARRRLLVHQDAHPFAGLVEHALTRWPWLSDQPGAGLGLDEPMETLYAGTAVYQRNGEDWWAMVSGGDPAATRRWGSDPLWIIEALALADRAREADRTGDLVRGEACRRISFHVDPRHHELQPQSASASTGPVARLFTATGTALSGDVFIAGDERIRRVVWTNARVLRPRSPLTARFAAAPQVWSVLELWDFGVDVELDLPDTVRTAGTSTPASTRQVLAGLRDAVRAARVLRARKRRYDTRECRHR